jgi:hypothetical protein
MGVPDLDGALELDIVLRRALTERGDIQQQQFRRGSSETTGEVSGRDSDDGPCHCESVLEQTPLEGGVERDEHRPEKGRAQPRAQEVRPVGE